MATTTVDTVTAALVSLMQAQTGAAGTLPEVQVTDGAPARPSREDVYTYGASDWNATRDTFEGDRTETYKIDCAVKVVRPGDSAADARKTAVAHMAAIETIVRANSSMGGASVDDQLVIKDHAVGPSGDSEGYQAVFLFQVAVEAFI